MNRIALPWLVFLVVAASTAAPAAGDAARSPVLHPGTMDLLPLDDLQLLDFKRENMRLVSRVSSLGNQVGRLEKALQQRADKRKVDAETRKMQDELRGLRAQQAALMVRVTQKLEPYGVDGPLVAYMNRAPAGPARVERYAYGLVLLVPDLEPPVRALFERVVAQMEGSTYALEAQQERMALALKQSQLEPADQRALLATFKRQARTSDQRFWQLVDCTLTREQRAWVWRRLPTRLKRKSQAVEHLFTLTGLTPSQASRIQALVTEMEHESSPDKATLNRLATEARSQRAQKKRLTRDERVATSRERAEVGERLTELRRYGARAIREILTQAQWQEYEAIPPRVSLNDRRLDFRRLFQGFTPTPEQDRQLQALRREAAAERRAITKRTNELRRQAGDYGPDSPQTMMMEMQMMGMRAAGQRASRRQLGRIVLEVLTPEQVGAWVMGRYGYKR